MIQKRLSLVLLVAACAVAPARADFLNFLSFQTLSFQPKTVLQLIVPNITSAPTGEVMMAGCEVGVNNVLTLKTWFFNAAGTLVNGPITISSPGFIENMAVGAGPTAFCIAYDVVGAPGDSNGRGIYFRTFTFGGVDLSPGVEIQAHTLTNLDERSPSVAGYPTASGSAFVITWFRAPLVAGGTTSGVYARRFTALGIPIDGVEVRIDATTVSNHNAPHVATWPDGRFVIAWMDGLPFPATGAMGSGTGVFARVMESNFAFRTGQLTIPVTTTDDQFQPFVACDRLTTFVCAWTSFVAPSGTDAFARRFNDLGVSSDPTDVDLTSTTAVLGHVVTGLAMAPSGEWCATLDANGVSAGFPGKRSRFHRVAPNGSPSTVVQNAPINPSLTPDDQSLPRVAMDQWGTPFFAYLLDTGGAVGLIGVKTNRSMVQFDNPTPPVGSTVAVYLDSPETPNLTYILGCSFGTGPVNVDYRKLPLSPDPLLVFCLSGEFPTVFQNFVGLLDATGQSQAPAITIPNDPALVGFTFYCAFGVIDPSWPSSVRAISHASSFTTI